MTRSSFRSRLALGVVVVGAAALGSLVTWAAGIPSGIADTPSTPPLVYSGVMLNNGVPVTEPTEVEVALWDDPIPGNPDNLLCETPEGFHVTPDASGAFAIPLPDTVASSTEDCLKAIHGTRKVYLQVKVDPDGAGPSGPVRVKWPDDTGQLTLERVALANVPFAIEAGRSSAAAVPSQLENRLQALEAQVFAATRPDAGPEIVDGGP